MPLIVQSETDYSNLTHRWKCIIVHVSPRLDKQQRYTSMNEYKPDFREVSIPRDIAGINHQRQAQLHTVIQVSSTQSYLLTYYQLSEIERKVLRPTLWVFQICFINNASLSQDCMFLQVINAPKNILYTLYKGNHDFRQKKTTKLFKL